jgi:DNA-binding NarL/FixJ family response regulator
MERLDYDGVVEPWKADLIAARARRMGFRQDEIPDVQQQMILDVAAFRFDAAKSNGAKESTALQSLIDNQLKKICRANARYRAHLNRLGREVADACSPPQSDIVHDVRAALAELPEREQFVGRALAEGYTRLEITRRLGCSWHAVDRIVRRIRRSFEDRGLDPRSRA